MIARYLNRSVLLEVGPAAVFYIANQGWGLGAATAAVMVATGAAVAVGYIVDRRVPAIAVATLLIVLALGTAALLFEDDRFIKLKATIGKSLFAAALMFGLLLRPTLLERALGTVLQLTSTGWRWLTFSWVAFAVLQAVANEVVRRSFDTDTRVSFSTALVPISLLGYVLITRALAPWFWDEEAVERT